MKFIKLTVSCPHNSTDDIAYALHEAGSLGEVFDDYADIEQVLAEKRWDYADAALFERTDSCSVSGFFTLEEDISAVISAVRDAATAYFTGDPSIKFSTQTIDSEEWENEWKKYYVPFAIGKLVIVPEWIDYVKKPGEVTVRLDPGLAFGTGMHETTSMCIELMQKIKVAGKRVLDFGCGSGILGICACALDASSVVFADTDEQAITATKNNCALNGIIDPTVFNKDVRNLAEPADIVLANITADVLTDVQPLIKCSLAKGGYAIISGIISDKAEAVQKVYERDFELVERYEKNEWRAFLFRS